MSVLAGLCLCIAAWLFVLRRGAGARGSPLLAWAVDAAPVAIGFAAALGITARPILSGLAVAALACGLSLADRVKRVVLREPVVFADRAELFEVVRHPQLYLPFAGSAAVLAGVGGTILALALGLAWAEPPLWARSWAAAAVQAAGAAGGAYACLHGLAHWPGALRRVARAYAQRLAPARDPAVDAARFGPLACCLVHATLAAAERDERRARVALWPHPALSGPGPVVLVQAESFVDPARVDPRLGALLPHWRALRAAAWRHGRLEVPAWGANTVRTEFEVLTGIATAALGLDGFNPYEAFVGGGPELPSLARAARAAGWRTVFVHPFNLRFYSRHRVLPALGVDELIGPRAFAAARRRGAYVADEAVGEAVAGVLDRHGPRVLVIVTTMEAHGPYAGRQPADDPVPELPPDLAQAPGATALARWLWHLQGTDRMLGHLAGRLAAGGVLAVYGDHQPSLPEAFTDAGVHDRRTDYLVWRAGASGGMRRDIAAHELGAALAQAATAQTLAREAVA